MRKLTSNLLIVIISLIFPLDIFSQNTVSATWTLSSATTTSVITSGQILAEEELFVNTEVNGYSGANGAQRIRMAGTNNTWPANLKSQIDTVYVQFSVSPKPGTTLKIDTVRFWIGAHSSSTFKANAYFSTDPSFSSNTLIQYTTGNNNNYLTSSGETEVIVEPSVEINDTQKFYVRIYPWNEDTSVKTGKYMTLRNVVIAGTFSGTVIADPPTVTTNKVDDISTTFARSGGNIPSDGGAEVTSKGVCWNQTGLPTTSDNKTNDGTGTGSFISIVTGLTPGTLYYLRSYAVNDAGTAYGEEVTFTTLDSITVPAVTSKSITNILARTAQSGGEVTLWGGDTVTVKGVCWNTTGNPTINDSKTENGNGPGSFTSILYPLSDKTTYYVRAYAINSKGTGYGSVITFTTQSSAPAVTKIVAQDGTGDYTTVQAAFDDVPNLYTGLYKIFVKNGTYYEKLLLASSKTNVVLIGEDRDKTILTYDDYAGKNNLGTSGSYSVAIDADDFSAYNITFQNTIKNDKSHGDGEQAVALRVNGDRQQYYNCKILGYQDTYYTWGGRGTGRTYMNNCYIEGSVDFIFGRNIVVFDSCEIHVNRNGGTLTAASTDAESKFGYVFIENKITTDSIGFDGNKIVSFMLGRPWQAKPRTVFIKCEEPANLNAAGWSTWNVTPGLYAEYKCYGPGSDHSKRISSISRQLTDEEAAEYTLENIFSKDSNPNFGYDWVPGKSIFTSAKEENTTGMIPSSYELNQNYPNPFNPSTIIKYTLPNFARVKISIYNVLGEKVATLVDAEQAAGSYEVKFNANSLTSGVYFYNIQTNDPSHGSGLSFVQTKKMLLLK